MSSAPKLAAGMTTARPTTAKKIKVVNRMGSPLSRAPRWLHDNDRFGFVIRTESHLTLPQRLAAAPGVVGDAELSSATAAGSEFAIRRRGNVSFALGSDPKAKLPLGTCGERRDGGGDRYRLLHDQ